MNSAPPPNGPTIDDLAAYALDAVDPDEALLIEARLATDAAAAEVVRSLRDAAGELAASAPGTVDVPPSAGLRDRVLAAARERRRPPVVDRATPAEMHRIELSRTLRLLRQLGADMWSRPVDPPEFRGWTVHDVVVHLVSNETLLASALGAGGPHVPEVEQLNEPRTALAQARHRRLDPSAAIEELEGAAEAVDAHLRDLTGAGLDGTITYWGSSMTVRRALIIRAFETWTHTDDIRRSAGLPETAPPDPSLRAMSLAAAGLVPGLLREQGVETVGRLLRLRLTGSGGGTWDVPLDGGSPAPAADASPDTELVIDTVAFCRAVSRRGPAGGSAFTSHGDAELAAQVMAAVPSLAVL